MESRIILAYSLSRGTYTVAGYLREWGFGGLPSDQNFKSFWTVRSHRTLEEAERLVIEGIDVGDDVPIVRVGRIAGLRISGFHF